MPYELHREMCDGQLFRLSIGLELVDDYLDLPRRRCRPNTWLNYAHDLKIFFNIVDKPVAEVSTADVAPARVPLPAALRQAAPLDPRIPPPPP